MVSIIVPIWNAAKTIRRCVDSIKAQTFFDWELLLSDDGSTDDSLEICKSCERGDTRIHVITNCHQGVSPTRNSALDVAKGEYICFVDADDIVEPSYLDTLLHHADNDLVVSGYVVDIFDHNGNIVNKTTNLQKLGCYVFSDKASLKPLFESGIMHMNWNKLFRREIIEQNHIRYKPYPINEDFIFMMEYFLHCKNLYVAEKAPYHWIRVENQQSGVESIPDNLIEIYNEAHELLHQFFAPAKHIADEIMYYSYELVALKYMRAIKRGALSEAEGTDKLKAYHNNNLVKTSFAAHHPKSLGEGLYYWLLRLGLYRIYSAFVIKTN